MTKIDVLPQCVLQIGQRVLGGGEDRYFVLASEKLKIIQNHHHARNHDKVALLLRLFSRFYQNDGKLLEKSHL